MITDGGSNQEEMSYMGKPCLLLRRRTERIEGLGANIVLSKNNPKVIRRFMTGYKAYRRKPSVLRERPSRLITDYLFPNI
jgi:UDP-N-acetylglucosamine 2-epimerase (non-hydrolysing)